MAAALEMQMQMLQAPSNLVEVNRTINNKI